MADSPEYPVPNRLREMAAKRRKGEPLEKIYCVENYKSGQRVTPSMFKSRCWDNAGETLPEFKNVDLFNLQFPSGMQYVAFRYCVSGIHVER